MFFAPHKIALYHSHRPLSSSSCSPLCFQFGTAKMSQDDNKKQHHQYQFYYCNKQQEHLNIAKITFRLTMQFHSDSVSLSIKIHTNVFAAWMRQLILLWNLRLFFVETLHQKVYTLTLSLTRIHNTHPDTNKCSKCSKCKRFVCHLHLHMLIIFWCDVLC